VPHESGHFGFSFACKCMAQNDRRRSFFVTLQIRRANLYHSRWGSGSVLVTMRPGLPCRPLLRYSSLATRSV